MPSFAKETERLLQRVRRLAAANLRAAREAQKLTLEQVAIGTDLGVATISDTELGRTDPQLGTLTKLAIFYGLDVVDLFADAEGTARERLIAASRGQSSERLDGANALLGPARASTKLTALKLGEPVPKRKRGPKPQT